MNKIILVVATIFIASSITLSDACVCDKDDEWQKVEYCDSQFIGTIRVLSPVSSCGKYKICYPITVIEQLRGDPVTPTIVRTNGPGHITCDVDITEGDTFFVASNVTDSNTIDIFICRLYENWTKLSDLEIKEKIQEYKQISCDAF